MSAYVQAAPLTQLNFEALLKRVHEKQQLRILAQQNLNYILPVPEFRLYLA